MEFGTDKDDLKYAATIIDQAQKMCSKHDLKDVENSLQRCHKIVDDHVCHPKQRMTSVQNL